MIDDDIRIDVFSARLGDGFVFISLQTWNFSFKYLQVRVTKLKKIVRNAVNCAFFTKKNVIKCLSLPGFESWTTHPVVQLLYCTVIRCKGS